jgi:hypothetical protein
VKRIVPILFWLMISGAAVAQTYSNASLSGNYFFHSETPVQYSWSKTFSCPTSTTVKYTTHNSITTTSGGRGIITMNGAGGYTMTVTNYGKLNATASANTMSVTWNSSCQVTAVNPGSVVYLATVTATGSGTYSVSSNGTGTLVPPGTNPTTQLLQLGEMDGANLSHTVLFTDQQVTGKGIGTGIAVHQ